MGVVTWKNIAPSNPAGILSAANEAAQAMGEGIAGIGTAAQGYSDKKTQFETDDFVADLMSLETQEERDSMIAQANDAWLNLDLINKTNYELGAPDREKKAFEEQLAAELISNKKLADYQLDRDKEYWTHQVTNPKPSTSSSSSSKTNKFNPKDNSPFDNGAFVIQEGKSGFGSGIGPEEVKHWNDGVHYFLAAKDSQNNPLIDEGLDGKPLITAWHINELANQRLLTHQDNWSIGKRFADKFVFTGLDGKEYDFLADGSDSKANAALVEVIYKKLLGVDSPTVITKNLYYEAFNQANPGLKDSNKGYSIFEEIYDENIKNKKYHSEATAKTVFGKTLDDDDVKTYINSIDRSVDPTQERYSERVYNDAVKRVEKMDNEALLRMKANIEKIGDGMSSQHAAMLDAINLRIANENK